MIKKKMKIIVGLGNPGDKFQDTRHNVGFMVLDQIKEKNDFSDFSYSEKFKAETSRGSLEKNALILAKPQTFMNNSGESIKSLIKYYKLDASCLIVIHDDIDIELGKIKISRDSGSAGHKGVQSIIDSLKTNSFTRIRMGILPVKGKPAETEKFVLKKFTKQEKEIIKKTTDRAIKELVLIAEKAS